MSNSLFGEFLKAMDDIGERIKNIAEEEKAKEEKPELLTAQKLQQLRWMAPRQLSVIYGYGKKKTHIDDDPDAYQQLRWFTQGQLEAIFGKGGMSDG